MLKGVVAILLVLCAIINVVYSNSTINHIFGNRGHNKVDKGFVIGTVLVCVLLYFVRHIGICLMGMEQVPQFVIVFIMSPVVILIAAPFMKNYCLNVETIRVALISVLILMFVVMPLCFKVIDIIQPGNNFMLQTSYRKYFMYESASNIWVMNILDMLKIKVSDMVLLVMLNGMSFVMWALNFLPYIIINCIITDELTYMEFCKKLTGLNIMTVCVTIMGIAIACCVLANGDKIDILYELKHY